jgi:hypothetical protein
LVLGGSWLTMRAALLLVRIARGAPSLLAARRLADNPKAAFRAVSGLVLAVFVGTLIAGIAPADIAAQSGGRYPALAGVLRVPFAQPLSTADTHRLLAELRRQPGVAVIPIYLDPNHAASATRRIAPGTPVQQGPSDGPRPFSNVISCASLRELDVLGSCPPGATAVEASAADELTIDNPLLINKALPIVDTSSAPVRVDLSRLSVRMLLVKTPDASTLERVRTLLTSLDATVAIGPIPLTAWQQGSVEPETFGEVAAIRNNDTRNIERVILAAVALTILVAGCSLAVTAGGSVIERKRPFTLLRLTGTPVSTLYRVVVAESMIPLLAASAVAAAVGFEISVPVVKAVLPAGAHDAHPGHLYYLTVGAGLLASLLLISATLPLLARVSAPRNGAATGTRQPRRLAALDLRRPSAAAAAAAGPVRQDAGGSAGHSDEAKAAWPAAAGARRTARAGRPADPLHRRSGRGPSARPVLHSAGPTAGVGAGSAEAGGVR